MLIPSIDLKDGAVVQLVQGERLAIRDDDVFRWVRRFERFPKVQVIDLDAAMGAGDNLALVRQIAGALVLPGRRRHPHRRTRARTFCRRRAADHRRLVAVQGRRSPTSSSRKTLADAVGRERVIAAVDSRGGQVVIHGWKTDAAAHRRRGRARARAVLRRVPLHPRRHRRADGRHEHRRDPRRPARHARRL